MKAAKVFAMIAGGLCAVVALLMFAVGDTKAGFALLIMSVVVLAAAAAGQSGKKIDPPAWESKAMRQKRQAAERKQQAAADGVACCPRCGSTSLSLNKKGFGGGKATAGMLITNGLGGAVAGTYGMNKMKITCMNCGYQYKPGKKTRI